MNYVRFPAVFGATLATFTFTVTALSAARADIPNFETQVAPLLIKRCVECHQGKDPSGGLDLTSQSGLRLGGESGHAIDDQHPLEGYLWERVAAGEMPPEKQGRAQKLPADELQLLRQWLVAGAPWPEERKLDYFERTNEFRAGRDWWSLQPIRTPQPPRLQSDGGTASDTTHPIDTFIGSRLRQAAIQPAPEADKRTLLTRLYYDLIGLPPTEEELSNYERDSSPNAWERQVDRLLEMPQYGERWGRYWLDLARYADTSGYERDQEKPFAWKYRDWVVRSFNQDLPYDEFILAQLAGDEMQNPTEDTVVATGFLRLGAWNDEPNDPADYQYDRLEDLVHTTSTAFLGLTVKCARCHSHKFDPITQEDYYRMGAAFWPGPVRAGAPRSLLGGPPNDVLGFEQVLGWTDLSANPPPLHLLKNGERERPMKEVAAASLSLIPALERTFDPPEPKATTTRRRLQLARWIADPANPLTARVLVNRVWQHHFGAALVRTPNNFGFLADPPTHPQLLDYLASRFIEGGFRIKPLHRLILTSRTWRQSSLHPDRQRLEKVDSTNRLWWRAERRRLDAEALRDSLLAVSGELDLQIGGPGFKPTINKEALEGLSRKTQAWKASPEDEQRRRSLYVYMKRGLLPPMMTTFDLCDPTLSCGKRDVTIVPTQALALLNNQFVHQRSERLAAAIAGEQADLKSQVRTAWRRVLRRAPFPEELSRSMLHLQRQTAAFRASSAQSDETTGEQSPPNLSEDLVMHWRADQAVVAKPVDKSGDKLGDRRVQSVADLSANKHDAHQSDPTSQPHLRTSGLGGQPSVYFDGKSRFLHVRGQLLERSTCTILCVVSDQGKPGHREIISNWDGAAGNSTSSLFLGLTGDATIRFSDVLQDAGKVEDRRQGFLLTAVSGERQAATFQNGRLLAVKPSMGRRRLDTPWVVGQQGNIGGEYWHGEISEIRVYRRALGDEERQRVERVMAERYKLPWKPQPSTQPPRTRPALGPDVLALASLCHALMNSNEFLFVD